MVKLHRTAAKSHVMSISLQVVCLQGWHLLYTIAYFVTLPTLNLPMNTGEFY